MRRWAVSGSHPSGCDWKTFTKVSLRWTASIMSQLKYASTQNSPKTETTRQPSFSMPSTYRSADRVQHRIASANPDPIHIGAKWGIWHDVYRVV